MNIVPINPKNSFKKITNKNKIVIQGPGENAGVIDIGDDDAKLKIAFTTIHHT